MDGWNSPTSPARMLLSDKCWMETAMTLKRRKVRHWSIFSTLYYWWITAEWVFTSMLPAQITCSISMSCDRLWVGKLSIKRTFMSECGPPAHCFTRLPTPGALDAAVQFLWIDTLNTSTHFIRKQFHVCSGRTGCGPSVEGWDFEQQTKDAVADVFLF